MSPTKVKICGITNLDDAVAAAEAGADYLGFIFWDRSKRFISIAEARKIAAAMRRRQFCPTLVGVFVDESPDHVAFVLDSCLLDLAQLSGSEPPGVIGDPDSPLYQRSYKALRPTSLAEAQAEAEWYVSPDAANGHPSLLLDAYHPDLPGGTGRRVDRDMAAQLAQEVPRLMLAGGLTPRNVAQAIQQVRPFAVDVASGVEASPGRKDHALVRDFISAARNERGAKGGT